MPYKSDLSLESLGMADIARFYIHYLLLGFHSDMQEALYITKKDLCAGMEVFGLLEMGKSGFLGAKREVEKGHQSPLDEPHSCSEVS